MRLYRQVFISYKCLFANLKILGLRLTDSLHYLRESASFEENHIVFSVDISIWSYIYVYKE